MNKSIIASAIISALLTGCGSGGGGSSSEKTVTPVTYTWQIVQLASVDETEAVAGGCIIYDDSELNQDEVITAYIAEENYNILYHNEDGTIETTISSGDDDFINGKITISADDVPDNGYVSLEEISSARGGDTGSYMFSVQKSLLSDMVLNVSVSENNADCYTGSDGLGTDYREDASGTALVNVKQKSGIAYYQSSYDENAIDGNTISSGIPVDSPYPADKDILITTFDTYDESSEQATDLSNWKFIDSANLYEDDDDASSEISATLTDSDLTTVYWSTSNSITLDEDNESGIIALHESNSYFWQPIYNDSDKLTLAYGNSEVSLWSAYYSGQEDTFNWLFTSFIPLTDSNIEFELPSSLSTVDSTISVTSDCSISDSFCINTNSSFSSDDFDYQRTHIRLEEDDEDNTDAQNIVYQSIYSNVTEQPVVLENSQFTFVDPTLTRIEINVMRSDADSDDATQYLMAQNMNLVSVGEYDSSDGADDDAETDYYSDINGLIRTADESDSLYQSIIGSTTTILMNANKISN